MIILNTDPHLENTSATNDMITEDTRTHDVAVTRPINNCLSLVPHSLSYSITLLNSAYIPWTLRDCPARGLKSPCGFLKSVRSFRGLQLSIIIPRNQCHSLFICCESNLALSVLAQTLNLYSITQFIKVQSDSTDILVPLYSFWVLTCVMTAKPSFDS